MSTLSDILGPWEEPPFESGLISRCRNAWTKPIVTLTRQELATLIRQKIALESLIPIAKMKIQEPDDDSELFEGELAQAIKDANRA
jgi:hypothetical protein